MWVYIAPIQSYSDRSLHYIYFPASVSLLRRFLVLLFYYVSPTYVYLLSFFSVYFLLRGFCCMLGVILAWDWPVLLLCCSLHLRLFRCFDGVFLSWLIWSVCRLVGGFWGLLPVLSCVSSVLCIHCVGYQCAPMSIAWAIRCCSAVQFPLSLGLLNYWADPSSAFLVLLVKQNYRLGFRRHRRCAVKIQSRGRIARCFVAFERNSERESDLSSHHEAELLRELLI